MKARNIQIGQELEVRVINSNYNDHAVEVKILEGTFSGKCAIVEKSDLVVAKYTVKAECKKYESEDSYERSLVTSNYYRTLEFELTIVSEDEQTQDYIYNAISNYMESELQEYDFQFSGCPIIENGQYFESASVEYVHGQMAEAKKTVMTAYKEAKKSLR
jgi:hypothetical protein